MDVLGFLNKQENYLKNGIYWCLRKEDEVSHTLRNLLWKDKVYPVMIDGFDEFFAEVYGTIVSKPLELNSNANENKYKQSINAILLDSFNLKKNTIIQNEIDYIKRNESSNDISKFINEMSKNEDFGNEFQMDDMRNLLEIDSYIEKGNLRKAYEQCEQHLDFIDDEIDIKSPPYIRKLIFISTLLNDEIRAKKWCDRLIILDEKNLNNHFLKANCFESIKERKDFLKKVVEQFPNRYEAYNELANTYDQLISNSSSIENTDRTEQIKLLQKSLRLEPSLDNPSWIDLFDAYQYKIYPTTTKPNEVENTKSKQEKIIADAKQCNDKHITTLELELKMAELNYEKDDFIKFIKILYDALENSSKKERNSILLLINRSLKCHQKFSEVSQYKEECQKLYEKAIKDKDIKKNPKMLIGKALYNIDIKSDHEAALTYLNQAVSCKNIINHMLEAADAASIIDPTLLKRLLDMLEAEKDKLKNTYYNQVKATILELLGDSKQAQAFIEKAFDCGLPLSNYLTHKTYNLLREEKYSDVLVIVEKYLKNFDDEEFEAIVINYNFAAKKLSSGKFNKTKVMNMSAQSSSNDVKICALILLDQPQQAKRLIREEVSRCQSYLIRYACWPVMSKNLLDDIDAGEVVIKKMA